MSVNSNGDLNVKNKIYAPGGIDPPYVSFSAESHETIREHAKTVVEHEKVMLFWNKQTHRMEVYVIDEDRFYTITGQSAEKK
jgi:hypothetical protein